jgi:hypothetical protein
LIRFKKIGVYILALSFVTLGNSQSFEHRKFKYNWNDAHRISFTQTEKFKNYQAAILYEETTINIPLQHIKRYQVFQFNDSAAIETYNLFRVPIPMDVRNANLESIHRADTANFPKLLYEKINFFDARIIRKGEFVKAVLDELAFRQEERTGEYLIPYYVHYFYVRNLEPGDQLEVMISHHWPLYTFKYYLNEILPKQEVVINIQNSPLGQVDTYINPQLARFMANEESTDHTKFRIVYEDVEPVDQKLSTNIYDLPRIEFYENKHYTTTNKMFGSQEVDTTHWEDFLYRFVRRIDPGELRTWENYDLQSYKTSLFFSKIKKLAGDGLQGLALMDFIQEYAADKLGYKNDFNFFIHTEHGFTDLGNYLEKDTLREASRHEFYFNMLDRIDRKYYKVFLQDHRLEIIDTAQVGIYYDDYLAYVMFDKDSIPYVFYPKKGRLGYYTNELPFYLSNQYVYLIPQTVPRKIYDREQGSIQYPLLQIRPTSPVYNVKKSTSVVNISLEKKTTSVESNLLLSGQFSTLLRGYYQYGWIDTTINPTYYADVFRKMKEVNIRQDSAQKKFPFMHVFNVRGNDWKNVYAMVDGDYMVDLTDLINMHYQNFDPAFFKANYQHDFEGKEVFVIELNFDQLVAIENMEAYTQELMTESFSFSSSLVKVADNQYGLKVELDILDMHTDQDNINQLSEVFRLIKKFDHLKLRMRVL